MTQPHIQQCNSISTNLKNSYIPQVDDYVKWYHNRQLDEGWIYFKGDEYLTIEVSVKDKSDQLVDIHKKVHCLVVCHKWHWNELEYIDNRRGDE